MWQVSEQGSGLGSQPREHAPPPFPTLLPSLQNGTGGRLGGSAREAHDFGSGHDLTIREFEPRVGLCADSWEPGACFGFCASLSLYASPIRALSLSLSKVPLLHRRKEVLPQARTWLNWKVEVKEATHERTRHERTRMV